MQHAGIKTVQDHGLAQLILRNHLIEVIGIVGGDLSGDFMLAGQTVQTGDRGVILLDQQRSAVHIITFGEIDLGLPLGVTGPHTGCDDIAVAALDGRD